MFGAPDFHKMPGRHKHFIKCLHKSEMSQNAWNLLAFHEMHDYI